MQSKALLEVKTAGFSLFFTWVTLHIITYCSTDVMQFLKLWYHLCDLNNNTEPLLMYQPNIYIVYRECNSSFKFSNDKSVAMTVRTILTSIGKHWTSSGCTQLCISKAHQKLYSTSKPQNLFHVPFCYLLAVQQFIIHDCHS